MSDELIVRLPQTEQLPAEMQESWDLVVKTGNYISRIQLYGSNSNAVKKEQIPQGRFGFPKSADEIVDLGKEVNCIPLAWSFKAMQFNGDEQPIVSYDPKDATFVRIKEVADGGGLSGSVYGIEFLLYLSNAPVGVDSYVTLFLNSASSRREAVNFRGLIGRAATLKVRLATNKKGSWHVPTITSCSTPFSDVPTEEELMAKIEQFKNPPKPSAEMAGDSEVQAQQGVDR